MGGIGKKAGAWDGSNSNFFNQMTGEFQVVGDGEVGNVGHYVIGSLGVERAKAGEGEHMEHAIAALLVIACKSGVIIVGQGESDGSGLLERGGGADGEEIVDFADGFGEAGRSEDPADAPSSDRISLAHAVDEDGAIAHAGEGHDGDVLGAAVDDVLIDFVGDSERV